MHERMSTELKKQTEDKNNACMDGWMYKRMNDECATCLSLTYWIPRQVELLQTAVEALARRVGGPLWGPRALPPGPQMGCPRQGPSPGVLGLTKGQG